MSYHDEPLPLDGLRVLDLGQIYNGAYAGFCSRRRVPTSSRSNRRSGDNLRNRPTAHGAWYPFFALNINKRSVCLDLKPLAAEQFLELVAVTDVVLENFAPGVMDRLGVGYTTMREANPRLIYASSSGYGGLSHYRDHPAMDLTVQAMVGVTSVTGIPRCAPQSRPAWRSRTSWPECTCTAALSALWSDVSAPAEARPSTSRCSTPPSRHCCRAWRSRWAHADETPTRMGNRHGGLGEAPYNVYPTRDGYVAIICVTDNQWFALGRLIDGDRLARDERFATRSLRVENIDALDDAVIAWTAARDRAEVIEALLATGVPAAPVRDLREVVEDPDLQQRGLLRDVEDTTRGAIRVFSSAIRYDGLEGPPPQPPPGLGEHTAQVLREWRS